MTMSEQPPNALGTPLHEDDLETVARVSPDLRQKRDGSEVHHTPPSREVLPSRYQQRLGAAHGGLHALWNGSIVHSSQTLPRNCTVQGRRQVYALIYEASPF